MQDPAKGLFAFEFNKSKKSGAKRYLSPLGDEFAALNIAGAVTDVSVSAISGRITVRVSDPTGVFSVDAGKKNSPSSEILINSVIPFFVSITGNPVQDKKGCLRIIAESVVPITRGMRDSWTKYVSSETMERMKRFLAEGGDSEIVCRYAECVQRALNSIQDGTSDEVPATESYAEKVLDLININSGGKGILVDELMNICISSGIGEDDAKRAIASLVEDGDCYLPAGGYIRSL